MIEGEYAVAEREPLAQIALLTGEQGELSIKRYGVQIVLGDDSSNQCLDQICTLLQESRFPVCKQNSTRTSFTL